MKRLFSLLLISGTISISSIALGMAPPPPPISNEGIDAFLRAQRPARNGARNVTAHEPARPAPQGPRPANANRDNDMMAQLARRLAARGVVGATDENQDVIQIDRKQRSQEIDPFARRLDNINAPRRTLASDQPPAEDITLIERENRRHVQNINQEPNELEQRLAPRKAAIPDQIVNNQAPINNPTAHALRPLPKAPAKGALKRAPKNPIQAIKAPAIKLAVKRRPAKNNRPLPTAPNQPIPTQINNPQNHADELEGILAARNARLAVANNQQAQINNTPAILVNNRHTQAGQQIPIEPPLPAIPNTPDADDLILDRFANEPAPAAPANNPQPQANQRIPNPNPPVAHVNNPAIPAVNNQRAQVNNPPAASAINNQQAQAGKQIPAEAVHPRNAPNINAPLDKNSILISAGLAVLIHYLQNTKFLADLRKKHPEISEALFSFGKQVLAGNAMQQLLPGKAANNFAFASVFTALHIGEVLLQKAGSVLAKKATFKKLTVAFQKLSPTTQANLQKTGAIVGWIIKTLVARQLANSMLAENTTL